MWAWRPSVHKKYPIWAQLSAVILGAHLFLLLPCFLLQQTQAPYHIQINTALMNNNLPVVFVPYQEQAAVSSASITSTPQQKTTTKKKNTSVKKEKKAKIMPKAVALSEACPAKALAPAEKNKHKKVAVQKKQQQKIIKKEKILPVQQVVQKELVQEKIEIKQAVLDQKPIDEQLTAEALCIGAADIDQLAMQNAIQAILSISWQPPVGIPDDVACQISFKVGTTGDIIEVAMLKPSGILMYDIAVQNALYESNGRLPIHSYGKEFCITFTQ